MKSNTFSPQNFFTLLFETSALVGGPENLEKDHDNPPRDLRIALLKKAALLWGVTSPLSSLLDQKYWVAHNPPKTTLTPKLLEHAEILKTTPDYPPKPAYSQKDGYAWDLASTWEVLIRFRTLAGEAQSYLNGFLCGFPDGAEFLLDETRLPALLHEVDRKLGAFLFPNASAFTCYEINEIQSADAAWF
jgi:hypothetical protein